MTIIDDTDPLDGIKCPKRLRRGKYGKDTGVYWAWPIDGYYDLHFVDDRDRLDHPDGSDSIVECIATLAECREIARQETRGIFVL